MTSTEETRFLAFQSVSKALQFDNQDLLPCAFEKYLESIQSLCGYLLKIVRTNGIPATTTDLDEVKKVLSVAHQCVERLQNLLGQGAGFTNYPQYDSLSAHQRSLVQNQDSRAKDLIDNNPEQSNLLCVPSVSSLSWSPQLSKRKEPLNSSPKAKNVASWQSWSSGFKARKKLSPLEQAEKENAMIRKVFETRIRNETDPQKVANLKLELQRRINENQIIAQKKDLYYQKKLKEKEQLAILKAQRKFILPANLPENDERRKLIMKILEYEQKETWPSILKREIAMSYKNQDTVVKIILKTLSSQDHPLRYWTSNMQLWIRQRIQVILQSNISIIENLPDDLLLESSSNSIPSSHTENENDLNTSTESGYASVNSMENHPEIHSSQAETSEQNQSPQLTGPDVHNKVDNIVEDISLCVEIIIQVLTMIYEPLGKEELQEVVYKTVEKHFLEPIWPMVLTLFRISNFQSEHKVAKAMRLLRSCSPSELGVKNTDHLDSPLFKESVACLRNLLLQRSLGAKVDYLVRAVHLIFESCESAAKGVIFGADDLLPLLSYALVQCGVPQLVSECQALDNLIDPRYLKGEEGYSMTSVQMALKYLETTA